MSAAKEYTQPISEEQGYECMRAPAVLTLNDGSVLAVADNRQNHGTDSPQNIETIAAVSPDGYKGWQYSVINHFDCCAPGTGSKQSASFTDPAIIQSKRTGRVFVIVDAFPGKTGYLASLRGTGFDENGHLLLSKDGKSFNSYVGDFSEGRAKIFTDGKESAYTVDSEYNIYLDEKPIYIKQINSDKQVVQNVFYSDVFDVLHTSYLWLRYSDDSCKTWSAPVMLNPQVKKSTDLVLGVCPTRGFVTELDGGERIFFTVYKNIAGSEQTMTIFSDDNGETWHRGAEVKSRAVTGKTSETQIVSMPNGSLRMLQRNKSRYVATSVSTDGGVSWTKSRAIPALYATHNCLVTAINCSKKIDGKSVIAAAYAGAGKKRANGVISIGLVNDNGSVKWLEPYHVNDGFYAYSCLNELSDTRLSLLYEDEPSHISYIILDMDDNGKLTEINGNDCKTKFKKSSAAGKAFAKICSAVGLL